MAPAVPVEGLGGVHQAEVGLVDQGGGLQRLPGILLGQLLSRQFAQLLVDQRQELPRGVRIALLDGGQDACHIGHRRHRKGESFGWTTFS